MNSMCGAAYPASCKCRTNMTGQDHAGQYIHADEAAKSRNKIFPKRSTIIALGHLYFILHRWAHLSRTQQLYTLLP